MTTPLCYLAAPYSDPSETIRAWHVARARLLARLAMACNLAPVVVHGEIEAGTYGDDSDPEQRARGMAATAAICRGVLDQRSGPPSVLWALLRDDQSMSDGTRAEWEIAHDIGAARNALAWADWRDRVRRKAPDLLPEWDRLAARPDAVGEWAIDEPVSSRWYVGAPGGGGECAALVLIDGCTAYTVDGVEIASGPETGALGRAAADASLRRSGVLS